MIAIKNLTKKYKSNVVLDNLTFEFNKNITFLYGDNGVGKSTLINILAGIIKPSSGYVCIDNKRIRFTDGTYKQNIGFVIDLPTFPAHFKLKEYIDLLNFIYNSTTKVNKDYQNNIISFFELDGYLDHQITELSTGFIKRVKLMASMLHNPKLFVWDEPFSGLDKNFLPKLIDKIIELSKIDKYFFISSHISQSLNLNIKEISAYEITKRKIIKTNENNKEQIM